MSQYHRYSLFFIVLALLFSSAVHQTQAHSQAQYTIPNSIEVKMFALRSDGSPIHSCQLGDTIYGCGNDIHPYPYSTDIIDVNLETEYLPFVVAQEMGASAPLEAFKAQAVVSRSYGLHLYEFSTLNNSANHQVFAPYSITPSSQHYQAVNDTQGVIMVCDNDSDCEPNRKGYPIFAEFSAGHDGDYTVAWPHNDITLHRYLASIYDPIHTQANGGHGRGMSQNGAMLLATGVTDGNRPSWDYRRILAHYYTNITFVNLSNTRNDDRFNALAVVNLPDGYTFYATHPVQENITIDVQNTGTTPWSLGKDGTASCAERTHYVALSYHIYEADNSRPACGDHDYPGYPGGNRCFEGKRFLMCLDRYDVLRPGVGNFRISGIEVELPPELPVDKCYNLRWDIELNNRHAWISRLQETYWRAQWPTQDTRICYYQQSGSNKPNPPQNPHSDSGHEVNRWSNNPNLTIAWDAPDGSVSGYEYRYQGDGSDLTPNQWYTTNQPRVAFVAAHGRHNLEIRAVANEQRSDPINVGPYLVDRQPPLFNMVNPANNWVTAPQIELNWLAVDADSGQDHNNVYIGSTYNGPWTPLALNLSPLNPSVSFTGNDDQIYYFRIVAYDQTGNSAEIVKPIQVRTFPYLSVSPGSLYRTFILTNTTPSLESLQILNNGGRVMTWTAETDFPYLTLPATTGIDDTILPITLTHPLTYGLFRGVLTITGGNDTRDSPAIVPITVNVVDKLDYYLPLIIKNEE